ncbi:related to transcription activator protein acu-15 [Phialocephala subalpina]|uniref:Related to transcription activator protein acu-15 n=1 Tax=Phialocephala subalpina TaxID=576137 RepID=A0A1L7WQG0_9HELO|nr:related to transcription activator protein acu-15 [Phialocephala subalpina]
MSSAQSANLQQNNGSPRKRRRIQLACSNCRNRKTKCQGNRPTCSACNTRGVQATCSYDDATLPSQKYVNELKSYIRDLESGASPTKNPENATNHRGSQRLMGLIHQPFENSSSRVPAPVEETNVDALGTAAYPEIPNHAKALYGNSSTIAFSSSIRQATREDDSPSGLSNPHASPDYAETGSRGVHGLETTGRCEPGAFLLPPRHHADDYLRCYWEFMHPLFPLIHRSSFQQWYQQIWEPVDMTINRSELDQTIMYSTLNVMLALGCRFSAAVSPPDGGSCADDFYRRSRKLLTFDILDSMHLTLVQLLLLTGIYLQSTKYADRCWNVVGLAIRVAHGLGLHEESSPPKSQRDAETRRRVWHTCVLLDRTRSLTEIRLLAMTFGRPTMISPTTSSTEIPAMIDDEFLLQDDIGAQPPHLPSRMGLFVSSLRLFDILDKILSICYLKLVGVARQQEHLAQSPSNLLAETLRLNGALDDLYESTPSYLKIEGHKNQVAPSNPSHITLQVNVLRSRFLYVRILLLRPVLLEKAQRSIRIRSESTETLKRTLEESLITKCCILCVDTAHALIKHLADVKETLYSSSAWHSVYFTFAAAMILVAGHLCDFPDAEMSQSSLNRSWNLAFDILSYYRPQVPAASQALSVLEASKIKIRTKPMSSTMTQLHVSGGESSLTSPRRSQDTSLSNHQDDPSQPVCQSFSTNGHLLDPQNETLIDLNFDPNDPEPAPDAVSALDLQIQEVNGFGPVDDTWFAQNFVETSWFDVAREWDQGGFFF